MCYPAIPSITTRFQSFVRVESRKLKQTHLPLHTLYRESLGRKLRRETRVEVERVQTTPISRKAVSPRLQVSTMTSEESVCGVCTSILSIHVASLFGELRKGPTEVRFAAGQEVGVGFAAACGEHGGVNGEDRVGHTRPVGRGDARVEVEIGEWVRSLVLERVGEQDYVRLLHGGRRVEAVIWRLAKHAYR